MNVNLVDTSLIVNKYDDYGRSEASTSVPLARRIPVGRGASIGAAFVGRLDIA
jgi:hypothetical protein